MGDRFGHWDGLHNADEEQRKHLMTEGWTSSNEKYTLGEYLKLAAKTNSHFAGENLKVWAELHQQVIAEAMTSGTDKARYAAVQRTRHTLTRRSRERGQHRDYFNHLRVS
jgi:hypothetical protein